jgi:hypothetical protein
LALLPGELPQRKEWERALGRWASACGCQAASVVALIVMVWLAVDRGVLGQALSSALASGAWCAGVGVGAGVLTRLVANAWARYRLQRLHGRIVAALGLIRGET